MPNRPAVIEVDRSLLQGVQFTCRPDCGLCCYATPAVTGEERRRLTLRDPRTPWVDSDERLPMIASRPDGGACYFLSQSRCRVHSDRPFPCAEFPISVHLGFRVQASVVWGCPGLNTAALLDWVKAVPTSEPAGIGREWIAVERELRRRNLLEIARKVGLSRRQLERLGQWEEPERIRLELLPRIPEIAVDWGPIPPPPTLRTGVENLPLHFDEGRGVLAFAQAPGGWQLVGLREQGGCAPLGDPFPPPVIPPLMTEEGLLLLRGYLRYILLRDHFVFGVLVTTRGDLGDRPIPRAERRLREISRIVRARATVLCAGVGSPPRSLTAGDVAAGIRATDLEVVDRPTLGELL